MKYVGMTYRTITRSLILRRPQIAASGRLSCRHIRPKLENKLNPGPFIKTAIIAGIKSRLHHTTLLLVDLQGGGGAFFRL